MLAGFGIDTAAAAADVPRRHMLEALRSTVGRGVCANIAAAAARSGRVGSRTVALSHRACPPPAARRAGADISVAVRRAGVGVAGWTARSSDHRGAPRSVVAAAAATDPVRDPVETINGDQVAWLAHLAGRAHLDTRTAVGGHVQCPRMLLEVLAGDTEWAVSKAVAANPACPQGLLDRFVAGDSPVDASSRGWQPSLPAGGARTPLPGQRPVESSSRGWQPSLPAGSARTPLPGRMVVRAQSCRHQPQLRQEAVETPRSGYRLVCVPTSAAASRRARIAADRDNPSTTRLT